MIGRTAGKTMLIGFKAIAPGASHLEQDKPCQDAVALYVPSPQRLGIVFAADGHGGEKYTRSDTGSRLAVSAADEAFREFLIQISKNNFREFIVKLLQGRQKMDEQKMNKALADLGKNIIYRWRGKVLEDAKNNPVLEKEYPDIHQEENAETRENNIVSLYGTTLIAAAIIRKGFWFALQIGDGACMVIPVTGKPYIPFDKDESLAFGKTSSLCNKDAIDHFRFCFKQEKIAGITVATDGVVDSFTPKKYVDFTLELKNKFTLFKEESEKELQSFLPELSERGSRDDVAIAGLFETEENE